MPTLADLFAKAGVGVSRVRSRNALIQGLGRKLRRDSADFDRAEGLRRAREIAAGVDPAVAGLGTQAKLAFNRVGASRFVAPPQITPGRRRRDPKRVVPVSIPGGLGFERAPGFQGDRDPTLTEQRAAAKIGERQFREDQFEERQRDRVGRERGVADRLAFQQGRAEVQDERSEISQRQGAELASAALAKRFSQEERDLREHAQDELRQDYSPAQQIELGRLSDHMRKVADAGTLTPTERLGQQIELQNKKRAILEDPQGAKEKYPPGEGVGDIWTREEDGARVKRNKDGEPEVLLRWDQTKEYGDIQDALKAEERKSKERIATEKVLDAKRSAAQKLAIDLKKSGLKIDEVNKLADKILESSPEEDAPAFPDPELKLRRAIDERFPAGLPQGSRELLIKITNDLNSTVAQFGARSQKSIDARNRITNFFLQFGIKIGAE